MKIAEIDWFIWCLKFGIKATNLFLFSFLNAKGEGFEAFFTQDGFLVLAVHTRKEFLTTTVTSSPFNDQEWVRDKTNHEPRLD